MSKELLQQAARQRKITELISRIQDQLNGLKQSVDSDEDCEFLVMQVNAIEKGVSSLKPHIMERYLKLQGKELVNSNPNEALDVIIRLFELSNR